jgi:S-ribosylhomocysteine lyase LuxS involved in autoinducer biosynthesis
MSSASGTRAINEAVTHHLTRVTAKTMRDANATHETWMDWAPAHDDQSGVIISLTSASGADQVITRILFRQEADPVLTGSFDEEEAPSVTISKILQFEPGTQQAISLFPEQWEEAAGSILDTLAAGGFDVPFTDCEKFTGHVELKCGDRNTTDLSIRIKLPNRKLCWTYASGTLHESSP